MMSQRACVVVKKIKTQINKRNKVSLCMSPTERKTAVLDESETETKTSTTTLQRATSATPQS